MLENSILTPEVSSNRKGNERSIWPLPESPKTIQQEEKVETDPIEPNWDFRIERSASSGQITGITIKSPDNGIRLNHNVGNRPDPIYRRQARLINTTHRKVTWKRFYPHKTFYKADGKLYITLIHSPNADSYQEAVKTTKTDGPEVESETFTVATLFEALVKSKESQRFATRKYCNWAQTCPRWNGSQPDNTITYTQRAVPKGSEFEPVNSCSDLTFKQIKGKGAHNKIDSYLRGEHTPAVEHNLGDTGGKWKAGFGAFHTPEGQTTENLIAVLVLDKHPNKEYFEEHNSLLITRIACHPYRPKNCSTWMIAKARDWARENGFNQLGSTAGVNYNQGMVYKAAGLQLDEDLTGWVDGDGWTNREGRKSVNDGSKWYKRKWSCELT